LRSLAVSEHEKSWVSGMIGEFLRETAVLVLVFVPLEVYKDRPSSPYWIVGVLVFSGATLAAGIVLERKRP
jgi:uncharacterized membrane protein YgdD (TMEM256/DUF423 family)